MLPTNPPKRQKRLTPLQEKFIKSGLESLTDEEAIELLVSMSLHGQESKSVARRCIEQFRNVKGLMTATTDELQKAGITPDCLFYLKILRELPTRVLKEQIMELPTYKSSTEISDYLRYSMLGLKKEIFKVIYLNNRNQITATEDLFEGTLDSIPIHPREIVESAIKHNANALILPTITPQVTPPLARVINS